VTHLLFISTDMISSRGVKDAKVVAKTGAMADLKLGVQPNKPTSVAEKPRLKGSGHGQLCSDAKIYPATPMRARKSLSGKGLEAETGSGHGQSRRDAKTYPASPKTARKSLAGKSLEAETVKTLQVVDSAIRAVQGVLGASQSLDSFPQEVHVSSSRTRLSEARRQQKERVHAKERSAEFTISLHGKLRNLADAASSCCSTSCGGSLYSDRSP